MKKIMELNKETALRLWTAQFGKKQKTCDFAGREIAKAAYNDRGSKFGWNVDHILPQSRGGKTTDYNLICCHIETNDEKADRFPCFTANSRKFEIQKRQNHYEIRSKSPNISDDIKTDDSVNFMDVSQGLRFWEKSGRLKEDYFVGYVKIHLLLREEKNAALFVPKFQDFIEKLFDSTVIFMKRNTGWNNFSNNCEFTVLDYHVDTKEQTQNLLDNCVLLNTYSEYFYELYGAKIEIICGMRCYSTRSELQEKIVKDIVDARIPLNSNEPLSIDELIRINTTAKSKVPKISQGNTFLVLESGNVLRNTYPYNYVFTKLQENLKKRI